jgi:hypothetical protein
MICYRRSSVGSSISPDAAAVSRLIACCTLRMLVYMPLNGADGEVMMSEQHQGEVTLRELAIRLLSPRYPRGGI